MDKDRMQDKFENKKDEFEGVGQEKKGDVNETVGDLRNDDEQQAEGQADQVGGKVKKGFADAKEKVQDFVNKNTD